MRRNIIIVAMLLLACISGAKAQNRKGECIPGTFNITAGLTSGANVALNSGNYHATMIADLGMRYDFHRLWGVSVSLQEEYVLRIKGGENGANNVLVPVLIEFHPRYFYLNMGPVFGLCMNPWVVNNYRDIFSLGGTLGIGGRIPLTTSDVLTVGANFSGFVPFSFAYENGTRDGFKTSPFRHEAGLRVGYEHRF